MHANHQCAVVGVWSGRFRTGLVYADEAVRDLYGLSAETEGAVPLDTLLRNVHPDDRSRLRADMARSAAVGLPFFTTYRVKTIYGVRRVATAGQCFLGDGGQADHYHGVTMEPGVSTDGRSPTAEVVDHLIAAREAAHAADEALLGRLIEAVMLEAGRRLAEGLAPPAPEAGRREP